MIQFFCGMIQCCEMIPNNNRMQQSTIRWQSGDLTYAKVRYIQKFMKPHAEEAVGFVLVLGTFE